MPIIWTEAWVSLPSGEFNLKEAYRLVSEPKNLNLCENFSAGWVWKIATLPKIKCLLWQCCHLSILVRSILTHRGVDTPTTCPICLKEPKTIAHSLRDCISAQSFWNSFPPPFRENVFYGTNLKDWLRLNCLNQRPSYMGIPWGIIFSFGVWSLWLHRNKVVFEGENHQQNLTSETYAHAADYIFIGSDCKQRIQKHIIQVKWSRLAAGWFKLNSNGSSLGNPGRAGGGGIIRNANGEWVTGYARAIGTTTSVAVELWAL